MIEYFGQICIEYRFHISSNKTRRINIISQLLINEASRNGKTFYCFCLTTCHPQSDTGRFSFLDCYVCSVTCEIIETELKESCISPIYRSAPCYMYKTGKGSSNRLYQDSISRQRGYSIYYGLTCWNHKKPRGNPAFQISSPKVVTLSLTFLFSKVVNHTRDLGCQPASHRESLPAVEDVEGVRHLAKPIP